MFTLSKKVDGSDTDSIDKDTNVQYVHVQLVFFNKKVRRKSADIKFGCKVLNNFSNKKY